MSCETRVAVRQAKQYDGAIAEYPGFMALRRNYGVDCLEVFLKAAGCRRGILYAQ
jgi:hypothetical protein